MSSRSQDHRRNEINMFAAMALGDDWEPAAPPPPSVEDKPVFVTSPSVKSGTLEKPLVKSGTLEKPLVKSGTLEKPLVKGGTWDKAKGLPLKVDEVDPCGSFRPDSRGALRRQREQEKARRELNSDQKEALLAAGDQATTSQRLHSDPIMSLPSPEPDSDAATASFLSAFRGEAPSPVKREDATNAFLTAFRGEAPSPVKRDDTTNAFLTPLRGEAPPSPPNRDDATNAFLSAFRGEATAPAKRDEATNAFLSAFRGEAPVHTPAKRDEATNAYLPAFRGEAPVHTPDKRDAATASFLSAFRREAPVPTPDKRDAATASFLSAFRGETEAPAKDAPIPFRGDPAPPERDDAANAFLSAFRGDDPGGSFVASKKNDPTGSFAGFDKQHKPVTSMEKSNLSAALAALEKDDSAKASDNHHQMSKDPTFPGQCKAPAPPHRSPEETAPMFAERVIMPRPLFFGPMVPPRVVRQARQMVLDAVALKKEAQSSLKNKNTGSVSINTTDPSPRLEDLPGSVRNIVGTLRVYGYGIDVLQDLKEDANGKECFWKGNPYVSTYQPLWGEAERAKRMAEIEKSRPARPQTLERPSPIHRSSTAPGRLVPRDQAILVMDLDNDSDEEEDDADSIIHESKSDPLVAKGGIGRTAPGESTSEHFENFGSPLLGGFFKQDSFSKKPSGISLPWGDEAPASPVSNKNQDSGITSANNQFSAWLRGGDGPVMSSAVPSPRGSALRSNASMGSFRRPRADSDDSLELQKPDSSVKKDTKKQPLTGQELFSQWARGETAPASSGAAARTASSTMLGDKSSVSSSSTFGPKSLNDGAGTFQFRPAPMRDSDDDSVEHDERKKQVGLNDHLSKALASLSDNTGGPHTIEVLDESQVILSQVATNGFGRPLTNYELTNGCAPVYGVDDPPLPVEGDLGIHETKDEQQRYYENKRAQEIVEKFVKPNIFGTVACPNPALGPDDFHSWNARVVGNPRLTAPVVADHHHQNSTSSHPSQQTAPQQPTPQQTLQSQHSTPPKPPSLKQDGSQEMGSNIVKHHSQPSSGQLSHISEHTEQGRPPRSSKKSSHKKKMASRTRYGWWNAGDPEDWPAVVAKGGDEATRTSNPVNVDDPESTLKRHKPPSQHSATVVQVVTQLDPTPGVLRKDNLPLSRMHAATSMAQSLPYLSDRPPCYRHLQIDTQAVGFPPLGGEIEPLFCSLGIYNIETVVTGPGTSEQSGAPLPDLQRCGRVTELLNFDVFSNPEVGIRCESALWPYEPSNPFAKVLDVPDQIDFDESARKRIGTRCGVFPLPSNLNFANLYAVLIVKKVLSEDPLDMYLKGGGGPKVPELDKLKASAAKASQQQAAFLLPFAFGVAPLLQVFGGSESPAVPSSRAVQMPLFRFSPGQGDKQIIDHIMVMLSPRDHRSMGTGTPVAATNGGTAMLVMRNFGFLGLHQVVDKTSSLARDRLVDFSGELQLRRKTEIEDEKGQQKLKNEACTTILPEWKPDFIAEPVEEGGRYIEDMDGSESPSTSCRYAQELSPVRLQLSPSLRMAPSSQQGVSRGRVTAHDIDPFYYTCFCNEILLQPRLLHNSPKGNIVIKAELRELEWNGSYGAYFAHLPRCGPSFHNNRRGPFLVQSVLSSCCPRGSDKHFIDEFKLKLPLDLRPSPTGRNFCLFFTVYQVRMSSKSKWKRAKKIFSSSENVDLNGPSSRVDQIASGFLPVCRNGGCLIDDGMHDVRIMYFGQSPPQEMIDNGLADETSLILVEHVDVIEGSANRDNSFAEDTTISNGSGPPKSDESMASASDYDSISKSERGKPTSEAVSLSVRVCVNSSLHAQNGVLAEYLHDEDDSKRPRDLNKNGFLTKISLGKELIVRESAMREYVAHEERLLRSTLDVVKYNVCPVTKSYGFLLRTMTRLWRTLIMGTGEATLSWANPATPIALRLHAFASILQLLGGSSLFLSKNGLSQADGTSKWSIVSLGRVVALFFDEQNLFGEAAMEVFHDTFFRPADSDEKNVDGKSADKSASAAKRGRHIRTSSEIFGARGSLSSLESPTSGSSPTGSASPGHGRRFSDISVGTSDIPARSNDSQNNAETPGDSSNIQTTQQKKEIKVDSKHDFQSALRAAAAVEDDFDKPESDGSKTAKAMIHAFSGPSTGSKRWMTAPSRALTTIHEMDDTDDPDTEPTPILESVGDAAPTARLETVPSSDNMDSEIILQKKERPKKTKQMRIPRSRKSGTSMDFATILEETNTPEETTAPISPPSDLLKPHSVPKTDDEIESAGTAFLDVIGKSIGISTSARTMASEEQRVGSSYHRKSRSKSSIDWTLIGIGDGVAPAMVEENDDVPRDFSKDQNERLPTLKNEEQKAITLPGFADRLTALEQKSSHSGRWFPFAYEVIILQWSAVLVEQRALGERVRTDRGWKGDRSGESSDANRSIDDAIAEAATRSIGVAVAGAPLLFEVIKESLGFRILSLFRKGLERGATWTSPPLVLLDETLLLGLDQVISMVADACIDSRNFDSWELRQMSIDVNDSIIRFLRDMFSFLPPKTIHQLILSYLSRFVTKEGKHWQDRDSAIGLRCSWEIAKLRLNAITALVRFPDFIRVNGPQMLNWADWWSPSVSRSDSFYDDILESYKRYRLPAFVAAEGSTNQSKLEIPGIHPHWLSEIAIDVCLLGTEHAEPQIQQRSAALLHELFWSCSQEAVLTGHSGPVAGMFIPMVLKLLARCDYLSNFAPKSQLRKDLLPCLVYVLQSAPGNLLRALWRKLCFGLRAKGNSDKYGGFISVRARAYSSDRSPRSRNVVEDNDPDVLDMITMLNLALSTFEYEGGEEQLENEGAGASRDYVELFKKEFLASESQFSFVDARSRVYGEPQDRRSPYADTSTTISRRWYSHDGALVVVNAGHQLVWELYRILSVLPEGELLLNPAVRTGGAKKTAKVSKAKKTPAPKTPAPKIPPFTHGDIAVFVRAASSLYLHALALKQSDVVVVRTFKVTAEMIKIFGIKTFLESVGETLQHWMRVISLMCGARRSHVRIEATDLLELILRSCWEQYGSFFRIRVPLLAVQTEVMERIVATAASRYYRDQRRMHATFEPFSNVSAEASLVPLWRTLDRIEKQPASRNLAFRGSLVRLAGKLKKLYRAYIAARVLSFIQGSRDDLGEENVQPRDHATEALVRANRINILRVINASDAHSKQFLGFRSTTQQRSRVAHFEAVEDALINAADVFSPTELPEHRVAWLRMLADFHSSRKKYAEEASCHFYIHVTLQQAARLHGSLWSNTPFLPWTDNMPDPVYIDGDSREVDPAYGSEYDYDEQSRTYGRPINSFRRIFYRVANSVAVNTNEWDTTANQTLFSGIATAHEYAHASTWLSISEMEDSMVEEAELAGDLFLRAGIIESSRFAWNLATQFYAQKFNYAKLALAYRNLERTVVSKVPPIDPSLPQEFSATLGRFYRVWFHGGAPDELSGVEFIYRAEGGVRLDTFGRELKEVIKSIIPDNTPIHLVLDGRNEERIEDGPPTIGLNRLGPTPLEPVRIKVTPLRPLFDRNSHIRGLPEWFFRYADDAFETLHHRSKNELGLGHARGRRNTSHVSDTLDPHHREHSRSYSASVFSSTGSSSGNNFGRRSTDDRGARLPSMDEEELSGVDKFCFVQPKDRSRSKDWWKNSVGDFADKTLKVTQLQVAQSFPGCVARQPVVHRLVYTQSPLEAGIDAVCQWCAVLFRTAVSTVGMAVLGANTDPGISTDAVKIVADCLHSSHVKEIGLALLKKNSDSREGGSTSDLSLESYDRLSDEGVRKLQVKLSRLIIVFIELLHLLIARNRQILLEYMEQRKRNEASVSGPAPNAGPITQISQSGRQPSVGSQPSVISQEKNTRWLCVQSGGSLGSSDFIAPPMPGRDPRKGATIVDQTTHKREASLSDYLNNPRRPQHQRSNSEDQKSVLSGTVGNGGSRGESAIAVQSELQRAFITLAKSLYPKVQGILQGETPRWLKQCAQDTYFSLGTYKQTQIPIAEELCYTAESLAPPGAPGLGARHGFERSGSSFRSPSIQSPSPRGSVNGENQSVVSRGSGLFC